MSGRSLSGPVVLAVLALGVAFLAGRLTARAPAAPATAPDEAVAVDRAAAAPDGGPARRVRPLLEADPRPKERPSTSVAVDLATLPGAAFPDLPAGLIDAALWPTLVYQHAKAGRLDDAVAVLRAAVARGATRAELTRVVVHLTPEELVRLHDAATKAGLDLGLERAFLEGRLAVAGRADAVVGADLDALSRATEQAAFARLAAAALAHGVAEATLRPQAERDAWPAWKLAEVATALEGRRDVAAARWRAWAERSAADAQRVAHAREEAGLRERIEEARERLAANASDVDAWDLLAEALLEAGDRAGAIDACERALAVNVYASTAAQRLGALAPDRLLRLVAEAWREVRDDDDLVTLADAYLRLGRGREAAETWLRMADPPHDWGVAGLSSFAPDAALRALAPRIARSDGDVGLVIARAWAETALGRSPDATARAGIEAGGCHGDESGTAWLLLAPEVVVERLEAAEDPLAPASPERAALAVALRRTGRPERVAAVLAPLVAATENWPATWLGPWIAAAEPDARAAALRATLSGEGAGDGSAWHRWAVFCALVDRRGDAVAALDRAIELEPDHTTLRVLRLVLAR